MGDTNINSVPSYGIKQYYVAGANGASVVRVAFDSNSAATTRQTSGAGNGVLISIGTKNLSSTADISNAINKAVYSSNVSLSDVVEKSQSNILSAADDAIKAASVNVPNEDIMGLLL